MKRFGIPTTYRGVRMRSRLEAKWAAFFDLVHWPWEYEPIDLDGYIPDFVLKLDEPVLVEVKPVLTRVELECRTNELVRKASPQWSGEMLLLGASIDIGAGSNDAHWLSIGMHVERIFDGECVASDASLFRCKNRHFGFCNGTCTWWCRVCGQGGDGYHMGGDGNLEEPSRDLILSSWARAANAAQWHHEEVRP